jgi:hypothetical protein
MKSRIRSSHTVRVVLAGMFVLATHALRAQDTRPDARWQAWFGCWEPADPATSTALGGSRMTCVFPSATAIEVATLTDGKIVQRQRLGTTTGRLPVTRDGCTGWESAEWSRNARRVYLQSEYTCPGNIKRTTNGLIALAPSGEWLDVEGFRINERTGVRVIRYREAATPGVLPAEISTALAGNSLAVASARAVLTSPLSPDDVIDATHHLESAVVETWLAERRQGFELDAKRLTTLADAGLPPSVIDVMVALSYPGVFALQQRTADGGTSTEFTRTIEDGEVGGVMGGPVIIAAPWDPVFGGYPGRSGYGGYYGGYPIGPYGGIGGGYGWYSSSRPVVVVVRPSGDGEAAPQGRAVKGKGYTQGSGSSGSTGRSSGGKGGSSSAGKSTGSSSGSTRTAKPRKGGE